MNLLRQNRVLFLEGEVDLPIDAALGVCFESIEFDWRAVARRIVSDLAANGGGGSRLEQSIFQAKWRRATGLETE